MCLVVCSWAATVVGTGEVCVPGFEPNSTTFKDQDLSPAHVPSQYGVISHGVPPHESSFLMLTIRCVCITRMYTHMSGSAEWELLNGTTRGDAECPHPVSN